MLFYYFRRAFVINLMQFLAVFGGGTMRFNRLISVVCLFLFAQSTAFAKSFLWRISHQDKAIAPSYVMGSIHIGKKEFYPFAPAINKAFKQSKILVLEARPDNQVQAGMLVFKYGLYGADDSLEKHISKKTWTLLEQAAKKLDKPVSMFQRMKPWLAALTLTILELQAAGYDAKQGVEMVLLEKAKDKKIDVLEGAEFQIKLFAGFSDKLQEKFLIYSIKQASRAKAMMKKMVSFWKKGQVKKLGAFLNGLMTKEKQFKSLFKKLSTDRNHTMAKKMKEMMSKVKETHFFVVGSAHLSGKENIILLLKRAGYRLEQL